MNFGISCRDKLSFPATRVYTPEHGRSPRYLGLPWLAIPSFLRMAKPLTGLSALVVGAIAVPLLAIADFRKNLRKLQIPGLYANREPIPPERFSWLLRRGWLQQSMGWSLVVASRGWYHAATLPASLSFAC